jgi:hypothetical protein
MLVTPTGFISDYQIYPGKKSRQRMRAVLAHLHCEIGHGSPVLVIGSANTSTESAPICLVATPAELCREAAFESLQ